MKTLIGIPTLNGPSRLNSCLTSIRGEALPAAAVVFVADDGSRPDLLEENKRVCQHHNIEMLFGHGRTGIARTWNRLVRHVPDAQFVVLVNDDVEVVADWLDVLRYSLANNPRAGMIGLNCFSGLGKAQAVQQNLVPPRPDYVEARLMDGGGGLVSSFGPIFGLRRARWEEVGGFDEAYFAMYEEVDLGVSLGRRGYFHYMASYPIVYHLGGATNSDPQNLDAPRCMAESRARFESKWGRTIGQLREEFAARTDRPTPREWNQQVKVWP